MAGIIHHHIADDIFFKAAQGRADARILLGLNRTLEEQGMAPADRVAALDRFLDLKETATDANSPAGLNGQK